MALLADAVVGWDTWNRERLDVWSPASTSLEAVAREAIGDAAISSVFFEVGGVVEVPVRSGLQAYFDRQPDEMLNNLVFGGQEEVDA